MTGRDTSKADRKAAEAAAQQMTQPFRQALAGIQVVLCWAALEEATEGLRSAMAEGTLDAESLNRTIAAADAIEFALAEARFRVPL